MLYIYLRWYIFLYNIPSVKFIHFFLWTSWIGKLKLLKFASAAPPRPSTPALTVAGHGLQSRDKVSTPGSVAGLDLKETLHPLGNIFIFF